MRRYIGGPFSFLFSLPANKSPTPIRTLESAARSWLIVITYPFAFILVHYFVCCFAFRCWAPRANAWLIDSSGQFFIQSAMFGHCENLRTFQTDRSSAKYFPSCWFGPNRGFMAARRHVASTQRSQLFPPTLIFRGWESVQDFTKTFGGCVGGAYPIITSRRISHFETIKRHIKAAKRPGNTADSRPTRLHKFYFGEH